MGFVVSENKLDFVGIREFPKFSIINQRRYRSQQNIFIVRKIFRIWNRAIRKTKTDIVCPTRIKDRIIIPSFIQIHFIWILTEASAFDNTSRSIAIDHSAHKVFHDAAIKRGAAIIHPFQKVSGHIAKILGIFI